MEYAMEQQVEVVPMGPDCEIQYVERLGVKPDPFCYNWDIIESMGDVADLFFSKKCMWLDLTITKDNEGFDCWIRHFKKINKPYILAIGYMKENDINEEKEKYLKMFLKKNRTNINKKIIGIHSRVVYGLFAKTITK